MKNKSDKPLVSICCLTFNHENYIRKTMEGFLMQKTNFSIEVLIHDDASTDGTEDIIREYQTLFPDIIHPWYEVENQWIKGRRGSRTFNFPRARGKYIAMCEGDDYWTDPFKLQKQVDFLERNDEFSISFHATKHILVNQNQVKIHKYSCINGFREFTAKDCILGGGKFMTTNSMLFRAKYIVDMPEWLFRAPTGDYALALLIASYGKIGYINDVMSVYRYGVPDSWSNNRRTIRYMIIWLKGTNELLNNYNIWTDYVYWRAIRKKQLQNIWIVFKFIIKKSLINVAKTLYD